MEHETQAFMLLDGAVLLGFALALVLVFRKLGLGATLGYLLAGALVGAYVFGLIGEAETKLSIAELGITFLLFIVGLELAPRRLWRMRREIFGLGLLQVTLCGLALAGAIWATTGFTPIAALAIGLPLALSSTAQVLPMLQSAGRLHTPLGERAFSILLFQDLSIIPLITIVAAMSRNPAAAEGPPGWQLAIQTVLAIAGLIAAGRFLVRPLFRLIGSLGEREMFVVAALFIVIAAAALMQALGLSTALGAFIAGVMLADSPFRHEIEADVEPFRSVLLGLFFMSVGMLLDLSAIAERPLFVLGMAVMLISIKAGVIIALGKVIGMPPEAFRIDWMRQVQDPIPFVPLPLAFYGMLITNTWLGWPLNSVVATGALQSVPQELYEAAEMDGANGWQKFRNITVAYLRPAMVPYAIYGFVVTFNLFHLSYFMSQGGPFGRTELLVTQAYRLVNEQRLYGVGASFSVIMFFILLAVTLLTNRMARATRTYDL